MLQLSRGLNFPNFMSDREAFRPSIYRLNWPDDKFNSINYNPFKYNKQFGTNDTIEEKYNSLPEPYETKVKNLRFKLNNEYSSEIQHQSMTALVEWAKHRQFDTMIREICLESAIANVWVAFSLLADCIIDENNNWSRDDETVIFKYAMCYKFWFYQTGRGLVWENARLNKLESNSYFMKRKCVRNFILSLKNHSAKYDELINERSPVGIEV